MRVVYEVRRTLLLLTAMAVAAIIVSGMAWALNDITCPNRDDSAFGHLCVGTGTPDLMVGTAEADDMRGLAGDDAIRANEDNDRLIGAEGDDLLQGQAGDDRYVFAEGWGKDAIPSEASGRDAVRFSDVGARVRIALDDQHPTIPRGASSGQNSLTFAANFIEIAVGGSGPDVIAGSSVANTLTGNAGNDELLGEEGNDTYRGVEGQDVIDDASGSADGLVLDDRASSSATFTPLDGPDADNNYEDLRVELGGGNSVIIKRYFDDTSARVLASGPGAGLIENVRFSDRTMGFDEIRDSVGAGEVPPPVANDDTASTEEDTAKVVDVLANDTGQNLSVEASSLGDPAHGTAQIITAAGPDQGKVRYTPDENYINTSANADTFTYEACDDVVPAECDEGRASVTVNAVNDQPTDISLSNSSVDENEPAGTTVGTLSTTDPDTGDSHTHALVSGPGDTDNTSFQISGDTLQTNAQFDFETKSSYMIRVRTDDGNGGTFEKALTISITNANDAPTNISLSNNAVDENQAAGAEVGTLSTTDQDAGDAFTYTIVSGAGDADKDSFQISGSTLQTAGPLNFEDGATRSVLIRTSDGQGGTSEKQFTITINDLNDAPTNLTLLNNTVDENRPSGATVGTLSDDDEDGDTPSFGFASGPGDDDNASFTISGDTLKTNETFDFEAKDGYTIRVEADDGQGGTVEERFTIAVTDANDQPTEISLSNSSVADNQPSGTDVGTLSSMDQDSADVHTYILVSGEGDDDNASFQISGSELQTDADLSVGAYSVRVRTDDGHAGGRFEKQFAISITDASGTLDAHFFPRTFNSTSTVDATCKAAQTFTAEKTVQVIDAQAYVQTYEPGDLTMQITTVDSSGNPTNNILASTTIADPPLSDLSVDPQPVTGNFSSPASVVSGNKYALVLSTTATNSPHHVWGNYARNKPAGPYAGGEALYKYDTQAAWQPRSSDPLGEDWGFAIYGVRVR
jgi:Cadherin domain/RTX calcium-binding nonapeptide repeat (4 copies)